MGFMTQQTTERYQQVSRRAHVPEWYELAQYIAIGVLVLLVFISLLQSVGDDPSAPPVAAGPAVASSPLAPLGTSPAPIPASDSELPSDAPPSPQAPAPAAPPAQAAMVEVILLGETGTAPVPAQARDLAIQGALAQFTGNYASLPRVASFVVPAPGSTQTYPSPVPGARVEVVNPEVTGATSLVFAVPVDPDAAGPQPETPAQVRVVLENGQWVLG